MYNQINPILSDMAPIRIHSPVIGLYHNYTPVVNLKRQINGITPIPHAMGDTLFSIDIYIIIG